MVFGGDGCWLGGAVWCWVLLVVLDGNNGGFGSVVGSRDWGMMGENCDTLIRYVKITLNFPKLLLLDVRDDGGDK